MPRFPSVSPTTDTLSARVFSELVAKAKKKERDDEVYWLTVGDTYLDPPAPARAEAQLTSEHERLHNYAIPAGEPVFLDAIVERLEKRVGRLVDRDRIQVQSGATAGLSVVIKSLIDVGEEVLLPSPYWPLIRGIIAGRGAVPVEIPTFHRVDDESFDLEQALESAVTDKTAAVYVNTPHNPTSRVFSEAQQAAIARVAKRHDLWVICDEAYEELWLGDAPFTPVWDREDLRDRAVATHTLSKGYGLAGARVGFTHGPADAMQAIRGAQTFMTYCAPRPMQFGAARALREGDAWLEEARRLYRKAGQRAAETLGVPAPKGGTFLFFDASPYLLEGEESALPFLDRCLDAGVLMTPGRACGVDFGRWVRMCFTSLPPAELDSALSRLSRILHS
jgi:N-succinyldiaminopimelate aminotransferase